MPAKIVVVGSYNIDFIFQVEAFPRPGETVGSESLMRYHGGKGSNHAIAAARLGADVTLIACVGNDGFGIEAVNLWRNEGIDTHYIMRDTDRPTGTASIYVTPDGENMISLALGANKSLLPQHVEAAAEAIATADIVITVLEVPLPTVYTTLHLARRQRTRSILNPSPARYASMELMAYADIVTPNELELEAIYGQELVLGEGAEYMLASESQVIVTTMGAQGSRWIKRNGTMGIPAYMVDSIDTTAAGDCFGGALAVSLAEGMALSDALRFANAAAAISTTRRGAARAMPDRATVDDFIERNLWE
jgi:ribokinase